MQRKQKPNDDERPPDVWSWQAPQREELGRSKTGTAAFAEFSKLTAKMVELSLQEAQRERSLRGPVPEKLSSAPSPLLWFSSDVPRSLERSAENAEDREW